MTRRVPVLRCSDRHKESSTVIRVVNSYRVLTIDALAPQPQPQRPQKPQHSRASIYGFCRCCTLTIVDEARNRTLKLKPRVQKIRADPSRRSMDKR